MSTKSTLKYDRDQTSGQSFHLYEECFEEGEVYLELEGFLFEGKRRLWAVSTAHFSFGMLFVGMA